jgi:hypothetical protein
MDDQDEMLEDPEVGFYLPDPNQDVINEYAIPQDEDEQLGNLPFAGSAVGSAGWNIWLDKDLKDVYPYMFHVSVVSNASHSTTIVATSSYFGYVRRSPFHFQDGISR